ncbi:MAG: GrpB family protein [Polaromonas sp.]|nr:GrpB family protein [Polaromonas sp.]
MVREGLRSPLVDALKLAATQTEAVHLPKLRTHLAGDAQIVDVTVQAIRDLSALQGMLMIVFRDVAAEPVGRGRRKWFMSWADGHSTHHLHVVVHGGPVWMQRLRFRDALRSDAVLAARYAALKATLALRHGTDREVYTEAKAAFVQSVAGPD